MIEGNRPPSANRQNSGGGGAGRPPSAGAAQRNNVSSICLVRSFNFIICKDDTTKVVS